MANNFFNDSNKAYSENLNDGILVGNAFDWTISIGLPSDTGGVFPSSSDVVMAKVADVSATPNSNLSIGSTIENNSSSSQVYRLTVYPNFNRFGGFKSISLTADIGVTFYIANKGGISPIASNLDYDDLGNVPELKVLKEYDIVLTIPRNKGVTGLEFVFQSSSADVSGSISQGNVSGLNDRFTGQDNRLTALETVDDGVFTYQLYSSSYNPSVDSEITIYCKCLDINGDPVSGKTLTLYKANDSAGTSTTNSSGIAIWTQEITNWNLINFRVEDSVIQVKAKGWRTVQDVANYTIYCNGEFVRIDFHHDSNATLPKTYDYTLPTGYYPKYNIGTISSSMDSNGVHYAVLSATNQGELRMRLHKSTYDAQSGGITVYGMLVYPY